MNNYFLFLCTYTDIVLGDAPNNAQKSPVSKLTQSWVSRYRTTLNSGQELNHPKWNNDHASCQENFELEDSGRYGAKNRPKMGCWDCFFVGPCYCVPQMVAHVVYVIAWFNEKRPISWDFFFDFFFVSAWKPGLVSSARSRVRWKVVSNNHSDHNNLTLDATKAE